MQDTPPKGRLSPPLSRACVRQGRCSPVGERRVLFTYHQLIAHPVVVVDFEAVGIGQVLAQARYKYIQAAAHKTVTFYAALITPLFLFGSPFYF